MHYLGQKGEKFLSLPFLQNLGPSRSYVNPVKLGFDACVASARSGGWSQIGYRFRDIIVILLACMLSGIDQWGRADSIFGPMILTLGFDLGWLGERERERERLSQA